MGVCALCVHDCYLQCVHVCVSAFLCFMCVTSEQETLMAKEQNEQKWQRSGIAANVANPPKLFFNCFWISP